MDVGLLPASATPVWLKEATGEDERLLLHSGGPPSATMLALAARLVTGTADRPIDWPALPAVDLGAVALLIRGAWLGNTIRTDARCMEPACSEPIDVAFSIPAYLEHHRPRYVRGASECGPGWFALRDTDVRFRIPTIADLLAVPADSGQKMLERCVQPFALSAAVARRIDRALEALAPRLDGELNGTCPGCGQTIGLHFEPITYVLEELRDACSGLYAHVHELALAYHWSEREILALDRRRRHAYVAVIRGELALV